jgi:hypothetical protein
MKYAFLSFLLIAAIVSGGCEDTSDHPNVTRVNVERVFQQADNRYSFMVREGNRLVTKSSSGFAQASWNLSYELLDDVPEDQHIYVEYVDFIKDNEPHSIVKVHVHSVKDVATAGYETGGKYSSHVEPHVIE